MFFLIIAFPLASCKKSIDTQNNGNSQLNSTIDKIGYKYHEKIPLIGSDTDRMPQPPSDDDYGCSTQACKVQNMLLADAVGGAVGSMASPFGSLWAGFLTSLAVEPYFRYPPGGNGNGNGNNENIYVPKASMIILFLETLGTIIIYL